MFTFLYDEFTQDNRYQILLESASLCRSDDKNILVCFFGSVYYAPHTLQNRGGYFTTDREFSDATQSYL